MMIEDNKNEDILDFELFFELSPNLLCIAGYDGYFKRINSSVSKLLGYTTEELMSKPIHEFIYSEDKEITGRHRRNLINHISPLDFENRYVTKSGEIVWLSWTSIPVEKDKAIYAIAKDITHKKKNEHERNQVISNLTKINQNLKLLTYRTSHDLRTPVNNLLSVFDLLDTSKITDEETLDFIEILKSATESLEETLNSYVDILNTKDTLNVPLEKLYLNDSLHVVLKSLKSLIKSSRCIIKVDFSQLEQIMFNKEYLESIFLNLISNSIKYARPGSSPVISIFTQVHNGVKQLIFCDEGQGFDMDKVKDKIFGFNQKFHEGKSSKGIGLYLVYNHITSLGGKIAIESKINEGSKFIISFKHEATV